MEWTPQFDSVSSTVSCPPWVSTLRADEPPAPSALRTSASAAGRKTLHHLHRSARHRACSVRASMADVSALCRRSPGCGGTPQSPGPVGFAPRPSGYPANAGDLCGSADKSRSQLRSGVGLLVDLTRVTFGIPLAVLLWADRRRRGVALGIALAVLVNLALVLLLADWEGGLEPFIRAVRVEFLTYEKLAGAATHGSMSRVSSAASWIAFAGYGTALVTSCCSREPRLSSICWPSVGREQPAICQSASFVLPHACGVPFGALHVYSSRRSWLWPPGGFPGRPAASCAGRVSSFSPYRL